MTRAAPAQLLGLPDRGHLGVGRAPMSRSIAPARSRRKCFAHAARVYKDGECVVRDGELTHYRFGRALRVTPEPDGADASAHGRLLRRAVWPCRPIFCACPRRLRPAATLRDRRMSRADGQRRRDRRHLRGSVRHARHRDRDHRRQRRWALQAATTMTGFATSVIGCGCEAGIDRELIAGTRRRTAGRACGCCCSRFRRPNCRSNCKTASANASSPARARPATPASTQARSKLKLGDAIRFFGDGWQIAKRSAAAAIGACR